MALKWLLPLLLLAVGVQAPSAEPQYGGKVTIGAPGGLAPLNPVLAASTISVNIFDVLFDRLLTETASGEIAPGLAVRWTHSEDYRTWEFELRTNATFHDGMPVTAADVVYTFDLLRQHGLEERGGHCRVPEFDALEAIGRHRVRVRFAEPPPASFLYQMRLPVLPRHIVEAQLREGDLQTIPFNRHPVGSGPFQVDGWEGEAHLRLTAFQDYWGGRPFLDTVAVRADYADTQALWVGLMRGEVDFLANAAAEDLKSIAVSDEFQVVRSVGPAFHSIALNCRPTSVLADRRLRRALSHVLDRRGISRGMNGCEATAGSLAFPTGPFRPGSPLGSPRVRNPDYDPAECAVLLKAAGWLITDGSWVRAKEGRALVLRLTLPTEFPFIDQVGALLRKDLEEVGIKLLIHTESYVSLYQIEALAAKPFDLLWTGGMLWLDPDQCASPWHSMDPLNYSGYAAQEVDRLIEQGRTTHDPRQRAAVYQRFHQRIAEDCPTLFICRGPLTYVRRRGLRGAELLGQMGTFRTLSDWHWGTAADD